jgi:IclR family acetate operon transcriptional repressor
MNTSVLRSFAILEYLANAEAPKELGVISRDLNMNKSTVYRFVNTLEKIGYVSKGVQAGSYSLGSKVVWLASKFLDNLDIHRLARPYLEALAQKTGETVHLAILDDYQVVYIDKIDGKQPVKMASRVGNRMPAHSTGLGKALLSSLDESKWEEYVENAGLQPFTSQTIVDPETFYQHMRLTKERGYAIDNCENEEGIRCVGVPIVDHTNKAVAALSITGWLLTLTPDRDGSLAETAKETAHSISKRLGFAAE